MRSVFEQVRRDGGRDRFLDLCRGVAAISVVWIHTVFHSGDSYVPEMLRSLALLVDVPLFVFLAGCSARYARGFAATIWSVLRMWLSWAVFCGGVCLVCALLGDPTASLTGWVRLSLCAGASPDYAAGVGLSMWFVPLYAQVSVLGGLVVMLTAEREDGQATRRGLAVLLALALAVLSVDDGGGAFVQQRPLRDVCLYLCVWLAGYETYGLRLRGARPYLALLGCSLVLWWGAARACDLPVLALQDAKLASHMAYLFASMPSLLTVLVLRGPIGDALGRRLGLPCAIGRDALMFYFSQAIGASVLLFVAPQVAARLPWPAAVVVCFALNLAVSLPLGFAMAYARRRLRRVVL